MDDGLRYTPRWQFHITEEVYRLYQAAQRRFIAREELDILVTNGVFETGHTSDGVHWQPSGKEAEWLRT
jgi:hypothetical protein